VNSEVFMGLSSGWPVFLCAGLLLGGITVASTDRRAHLRLHGIDIREDRGRVKGEGRSVYFYDYDNHLFELHTGTLEQRLERYREGLKP
jgi:hypothetical protein